MKQIKNIAVLLTVFNRREETLACLDMLFRQEIPGGFSIKVYLVDDASTDGTSEAVASLYPSVKLIKGNGSLFWNRGMRRAWEEAEKEKHYDYFLWLNDDTHLFAKALVNLLECSCSHSDSAIIIGSTVDVATHSIQTYGGRIKNIIPECRGEEIKVNYFNGNIVLIPRSVFDLLGYLDGYFSHSKGDFDYGMRAKKQGIDMYQLGVVAGECDVHKTMSTWCDPDVPFKKRWKAMHRPNGMPPKESFFLNHRHYGLLSAIRVYCTIHIRCIFPKLWK